MKCHICKTESEFEAAFIKEWRSFRTIQSTVCPACWVRRRNRFEGTYQLAILAGAAAGYGLLWLDPRSTPGTLLTALFLINLFLILSIIPHELGHAVAARLAGWRVFQIVIGIGKSIYRRNFFGILFDFHRVPVNGTTVSAPMNTRWFRIKRTFILLAGPAVNAVSASAVFFVYQDAWRNEGLFSLPPAPRYFFLANLCVLAVNLWPRHLKTLGLPSDGRQLLNILTVSKQAQDELVAMRYVLEANMCREHQRSAEAARAWCDQGLAMFPENLHLMIMSGVLLLDQHEYERARDLYLKLLDRNGAENMRHILLNNIAYIDALIGRPELLSEANDYSKQAYDAQPWAASIIGTRGTVLVAMNLLDEGIALLIKAYDAAESPRSKAENACHLSVAHARKGNSGDARKYLDLAGQLDSQCTLIRVAEGKLHGSASTSDP